MEVQTKLGSVIIPEGLLNTLQPNLSSTSKNDEIERIIRVAMQATLIDASVAFRIAVSKIASEFVQQVMKIRDTSLQLYNPEFLKDSAS